MARRKQVPTYRKHKATGQAVVTINGRDLYLGKHGTQASRLEYDRIISEWLAAGRTMPSDLQELTVVEIASRYLRYASGYYRKDGRCTKVVPCIKATLRYVLDQYGRTLAREFGPLALKAVRQRMIDDGQSRRYCNDSADRIKRMFKWAAGEELVDESVYRALTMVGGLRKGRSEARETAPVLPVTDEVIAATLEHLPEVVADMVRLQRLTGARPGEVCILRPCDLDRSEDVWSYRPESHKTEHHGRERVVFIGPKAQGILLRYLSRDPEAFCFRPCDSEAKRRAARSKARSTPLNQGNVVGSNRNVKPKRSAGECYSVDSFRRAIHRAADRAGVEKWAPNRLRHTAATEIRREFGLEAAQVTLGHASADVSQVYAERDHGLASQVAKQIG